MKSKIIENTASAKPQRYVFVIGTKIDYLSNDSDTYELKINFDGDIGQYGTRTLKPMEVIDNIVMDCNYITIQGIGGNVPFRISGV